MYRVPILELNKYTPGEQLIKVLEECSELAEASEGGNHEHMVEECLDVIQAAIGLFEKISNDKIRDLLKHELKMKEREAQRRIDIKGWLNIEYKGVLE